MSGIRLLALVAGVIFLGGGLSALLGALDILPAGAVAEQRPGAQLRHRAAAAVQIRAGAVAAPTVGIYQLDGIVRRAPSLQQTADALEGASA